MNTVEVSRPSVWPPWLFTLLVHAVLLAIPQFRWEQSLSVPAEEEETRPKLLQVVVPDEPLPPRRFGDAARTDDAPAPRRVPQAGNAPVLASAPPAAEAGLPPLAVAPPAAPEFWHPEPVLPPIPPPQVSLLLPSPVRPVQAQSPTPTASVSPTAQQTNPTTMRHEQNASAGPTTPTPESWFLEYNRRHQALTLADSDASNSRPEPAPGQNGVGNERYEISSDGSLTIYTGKGRRGTRVNIDLGSNSPRAINEALAPFGGRYWQGYRDAVEAEPRRGEPPLVGSVGRGAVRYRPVQSGGPGYYILIDWGDEQRLGRHIEELVNRALEVNQYPDDVTLHEVTVGITLSDRTYVFYVQSLRTEAERLAP